MWLPGSLGPIDEGLSDIPDLEDARGLDVVPVLASEGVHDLLLGAFLAALHQTLKRPNCNQDPFAKDKCKPRSKIRAVKVLPALSRPFCPPYLWCQSPFLSLCPFLPYSFRQPSFHFEVRVEKERKTSRGGNTKRQLTLNNSRRGAKRKGEKPEREREERASGDETFRMENGKTNAPRKKGHIGSTFYRRYRRYPVLYSSCFSIFQRCLCHVFAINNF